MAAVDASSTKCCTLAMIKQSCELAPLAAAIAVEDQSRSGVAR